ncbi:MAG: crossover junction endodeoxyribonuclease RuvC [Clostridia bacterium]|nr:crossover junction endodeoxyribonuclease RuvC [Clostridia bacterium]
MRILGIDPGFAIVGYAIIDCEGNKFSAVECGSIQTKAGTPFEKRLVQLYDGMKNLMDTFKPDAVAMEELFFNTNVTTGIQVGHARGVLMLAAVQEGCHVFEYTPLQVKQAVVGYGRADKKQVQQMVKAILHLETIPKLDDTADAMAIAVCHAHVKPPTDTGGGIRILRERKGI